jgi:hypothetical protein
MSRRIDVETDDILQLVGEFGIVGDLEASHPMRLQPLPRPDRHTEEELTPTALASAGAVQWVVACGGDWLVSATTRSTVAAASGGIRDGRVLSRINPATPWCMKRACRRQTTVLSLPRRQVMALVPSREQPPSG